ncbi:AAA family ATPase [Microbispora sp. NPDC088329]|uniref:AAA family ATPase n=1 Tax=Microbispora sp. NPDC088329 TaxID=3154869 RepID=UPI00341F348C
MPDVPRAAVAATLDEEVEARLAEVKPPAEVAELVRAALGAAPPQDSPAVSGVYLGAVTVRGFRGIGRAARLSLTPGNGLTLVTGRNGSGKSSFAEAVETALTGENSRWRDRSQIWTGGFANLHAGVAPEIEVELAIAGDSEPSVVRRTWTDDRHDTTAATVTRPGRPETPLAALGLARALTDFRPFLPYAELGTALDKPTEIHDKISAILGLGRLAAACTTLHEQALALDKTARTPRKTLPPLLARLAGVSDSRAAAAHAELSKAHPDLSVAEALVTGERPRGAEHEALRRLADLTGPAEQAVRKAAARLRRARHAAERVRDSAAEDAGRRADLLDLALAHHRRHPDDPACPACGTPDALGAGWAERAAEEVARLRREAADATAAVREARDAGEAARRLIADPPPGLPERLAGVWQAWTACRALGDPGVFEAAGLRLAAECAAVREEARRRLAEMDGDWREVAPELAAWCRDARAGQEAKARLALVKKADALARDLHDTLRAERMAAQGQEARLCWQIMRGHSNVALREIRLEGRGNQRRAELSVAVDDIPGAALGVMSQGELHALALSLFLPRALVDHSPFRFLVIDDPVQSMDPEKVDGLAQLLDEVARKRQVIVFTHDTRLPQAIRRLGIEATILEVSRGERSEIDIAVDLDPVERALREARGVALNPRLPRDVGQTVLPGLCRVALETAFVEAARRRLLSEGVDYTVTERDIADARSTAEIAALALGVPREDVPAQLDHRFGDWAGAVYRACNQGSHNPRRFHEILRGHGKDPIGNVTRLARRLREAR